MGELERPVGRVFWRLRIQRFLGALTWAIGIGFLVVAAVLAAERLLARPIPGPAWLPFAVAGGLALIAAGLFAALSGPTRLDAAVAVDRAFQLDERLSSALSLPEDLRNAPAGIALLADAARKVEGLDLGSKFGLRPPRRAWLVLIPATLAIALLFVPPWESGGAQARVVTDPTQSKEIAKQAQALTKKIASQRQQIDKDKFPEADKLLTQIEKKSEELSKAPPGRKDKLMVELNKLSDALKDRQKQLASPEQLNHQLQQLKEMGSQGPADQMAKELSRGDYQKAADRMKEIHEKLTSGKLSQPEKKALQNQLAEMSQKLQSAANQDERKKQLDEARKNGALSQQQYEREMAKLKDISKGLQKLQDLASKLDRAQKALSSGDTKKAAAQLGITQEQLADMAQQLQELQALDSAMADISDAKNGMSSDGMNQLGDAMPGMGGDSNRRGNGMGRNRGRGAGDRPEAEDKTSTYTTQVKQQMVKGKAVFQGFAPPGKAVKGESVIDIQAELDAGSGSDAGALSNQKIPKSVEKHIRSYYDQINKSN